ncbi:signal peptidase II [Pseudozobellia sp. WGM2]|uniref:signal peptidase II n=1 Tax=Pseudozobellia sp. WGM2 TaxID=2787625 RepID=UPI001ADF1102|nr:signal peptidase II [Pseudozobellia sp. WGM2]
MSSTRIRRWGIIVLVILNFGCDQISKNVVRKEVSPNDYIQVVGDSFILTNVENSGAMLGFGQNFPPILKIALFQVLPIMVLLVLLYRILKKKEMNLWLIVGFAFVIGGGIGNLVDRIAYGSVTDFFQIKLGFLKTGIFNMADVSVTSGVLLLLLLSFRKDKPVI